MFSDGRKAGDAWLPLGLYRIWLLLAILDWKEVPGLSGKHPLELELGM